MEGNSRKASEEGVRNWPHRGVTSLGVLSPFFQMMPLRPSFTPLLPSVRTWAAATVYEELCTLHLPPAVLFTGKRGNASYNSALHQPGWGAQDEQVVGTTLVIVHKRNKPLFLKKYQYAFQWIIQLQKEGNSETCHSKEEPGGGYAVLK